MTRYAEGTTVAPEKSDLFGRVEPKPLRALTLHRPWPWSILHGGKRIENRPWRPWRSIVGERIALHAGLTWDASGAAFIKNLCPSMPMPDSDGQASSWRAHPSGVIVGVGRIAGCIEASKGPFRRTTELDTRWFFGPFGWILEDVVALATPVPCRGAQGLWIPPPDVTARVLEQIGRAA